MKKTKYAVMIPLIGGLPIGAQRALSGQTPEYVLSYKAFASNDSHYINYLKENKNWHGEYYVIDDESAVIPKLDETVDFVQSCCPCAGLSGLSSTSSSNSEINDWMYNSSEFVLTEVKPKVLWGENAPALSTNKGRAVADKLYEIGARNGYSLLLVKTSSRIHGNPQNRTRTFFFFIQSHTVPLMHFPTRDKVTYGSIMSEVVLLGSDPMNVPINTNTPSDDPFVKYLMYLNNTTYKEYIKNNKKTVTVLSAIQQSPGQFQAAQRWLETNNYTKEASRSAAIQKKLDANMNFWSYSTTFMGDYTGAFVGAAPITWAHPTEDRYLTFREGLHLMGMPDDFQLLNPIKNTNHICQNVPVNSAEDMAKGVLTYLNESNHEMLCSDYLVHNLHNNLDEYRSERDLPKVANFI